MSVVKENRFQWFPWYAADFLTDRAVQFASLDVIGAYVFLLSSEWVDGPLPDDDTQLAILSRADSNWERIRDPVLAFFTKNEDGAYVNGRLEEVRNEQIEKANLYRESGRRGADIRWNSPPIGEANSPPNATLIATEQSRAEQKKKRGAENSGDRPSDWTTGS